MSRKCLYRVHAQNLQNPAHSCPARRWALDSAECQRFADLAGAAEISSDFSRGPRVAAGDGNLAIAVWTQISSSHGIAFSDLSDGGTWPTASYIPGSTANGNAEAPAVAMSANGNVVAAWESSDAIQVAIRLAGGSWSLQNVGSTIGGASNIEPHVAINASGDTLLMWEHISAGAATHSAQVAVAADGGAFGGVQAIGGANTYQPAGGIDDAGNSVVFFNRSANTDNDDVYITRSVATAAFGGAVQIDDDVSNASSVFSRPRVAVNPSGRVIAAWQGNCYVNELDCSYGNPLKGATGTTTGVINVVRLTDPDKIRSERPEVAIDANGKGFIAWMASDGSASDPLYVHEFDPDAGWSDKQLIGALSSGYDHEAQVTANGGRGLVVYTTGDSTHSLYGAESALGTFTDGWESQLVSSGSANADSQAVALSGNGRAAAAWRDPDTDRINANVTTGPTAVGVQPIIVVPGVMGSNLACGDDEVFPNVLFPEFLSMMLRDDGFTNSFGPCNSIVAPTGELRSTYSGVMTFFNELAAPRGRLVFHYAYDWRHSVDRNVAGLDEVVQRAKRQSGADKVQIVAYSMGGIVSQLYIKDEAQAANVQRLVTVETPYWGSLVPWLALSHGQTLSIADAVIIDPNLHLFAVNAAGLYSLYPSSRLNAALGGWLNVPFVNLTTPSTDASVLTAVDHFFGNSKLAAAAQKLHKEQIDGFDANGVDYHAIVSSGLPTPTHIIENFPTWIPENPVQPIYSWGDGDEVVPMASQTQGADITDGNPNPLGDDVKFELICGGSHGSDDADEKTQPILTTLLNSNTAQATHSTVKSCPRSVFWEVMIEIRKQLIGLGGKAQRRYTLPSKLAALVKARKVTMYPSGTGGMTLVVTSDKPVTLPVTSDVVTVRKITRSASGKYTAGATSVYNPKGKSMTLSLNSKAVVVKSGSKRVRPTSRERKGPVVRLKKRNVGSKVRISVTARDASGVTAIFVQIGKADPVRIKNGSVTVPKSKLRTVQIYAVDRWGNRSKPKKP